MWFETTQHSKNRYVGVLFSNCYAPLRFLCRSAAAHLYVWLTFAPWKCYQPCNQANSRADGQCQYQCFWSGCLMRSESETWASFILLVSHGRYTWCKCSCCSRSQIHQSKEEPFPLIFYLPVTVSIHLRSCCVMWSAVIPSSGQSCSYRQSDQSRN